jgi:hypothetical protein
MNIDVPRQVEDALTGRADGRLQLDVNDVTVSGVLGYRLVA